MNSPKTTNTLLIIILVLIVLGAILYFVLPLKTQAPENTSQTATSTGSTPAYTYTTKTITDSNAKKFYSIKASYPLFALADGAIEKKINSGVAAMANQEIDDFRSSFDDTAASNGESQEEYGTSTFDLTFSVATNQQLKNILAIQFDEDFYSAGAAHPGETISTLNYDLKTGQSLALSDLFRPGSAYLEALSSHSIEALKNKLGTDNSEDIETGAGPTAENFKSFLVTDQGLKIIFNEYQVAAYAAGSQEITIPWSTLKDILNPGLILI